MLWPFNRFRKPRPDPGGTIETIYGMIVTQAREPMFYRELAVPDSVDGRFDLLLLHLWLLLRRLRTPDAGSELSQALFDRFCEDMDDNLRELGVGDQSVPKRMRAFGEAFYGRSKAYDDAIGDAEALASAISRNILNGKSIAQARRLGAYVRAVDAKLAASDLAVVLSGAFVFPSPLQESVAS